MGKLTDSLLSGSSGRVGRLVVANVAGTEILRVRPKKRTGQASASQILVQERMKKAYQFIVPYKAYALRYYGYPMGMRSRYNQAVTNVLNAFKIDFDMATITPSYNEIEFSKGNLLGAVPVGLTSTNPLSIKIDWYNNSGSNLIRSTDEMQLLLIADGEETPLFLEAVATREDTTWVQDLPPYYQNKNVQVWMAFRSADLKEVSASTYVGSVLVI